MPLPSSWVDSLFGRLAVRYGSAWKNMWDGLDVALVKADWANELAGFEAHPDAIKHALDNLPPDRPPTLGQFRELCRRASTPAPLALPAPDVDPAVIEKSLAMARSAVSTNAGARFGSGVQWAVNLQERERRGDRLTRAQRAMWREALGVRDD